MFSRQSFVFIFFGVFFDQVTKFLAHHFLYFKQIQVVPFFLSFQLVHNYGAAYGIFEHQRYFLIGVHVLVIVGMIFFWKHFVFGNYSMKGLVYLFTGAIGNLIDRLFRGYVIDFVDIQIIPVFNLADFLITVGVALLFIDVFKPYVSRFLHS